VRPAILSPEIRKSVIVFAAVAAACVFLLYSPLFHSQFVYDDLTLVVQNPKLAHLGTALDYFGTATPFGGDFRHTSAAYYRPLTWLSFWLDLRLYGPAAGGLHFTSLLFHWLNGVLAFVLLLRLGCKMKLAGGAVLLWLALPVNSEAVAWISARSYSLMFCFLLIALHAALSYLDYPSWGSLALFYGAAAGAVFAHETGVLVLPLAAMVLWPQRPARRAWTWLAGCAVLADVAYFICRYSAGGSAPGIRFFPVEFGAYFIRYLSWMILPVRMSMERSTDTPAPGASVAALVCGFAVFSVIAAAVAMRKKAPEIATALLWMCVALLPLCGFVFIYQGMAERYSYVASLGLCFAVVATGFRVPLRARTVAFGVVAIWGLWGAWRSYVRASDWTNERALFTSSLEATPKSWILWLNLGNAYLSSHDLAAAAQDYRAALRINPHAGKAHDNLATVMLMGGDRIGAEREYRQAIAEEPNRSDSYSDLAVVLFDQGRFAEAERLLMRAVQLDSSNATAYFDLGVLYARTGKTAQAAAMYRLALGLNPNYPDAERALQLLGSQ
jgi:protein O-mannosyl-transferase